MSWAQDQNDHNAQPQTHKEENNKKQTAACQTVVCLPAVVQAADNIDISCHISSST